MILTLLAALIATPMAEAKPSIRQLPELSKIMFHHYECRASLIVGDKNEVLEFNLPVGLSGHGGQEQTLKLDNDQLVTSANAQSLKIEWTRSGRPIAQAQMMIQRSPTPALVLIVGDPTQEGNQGDINCTAVTFAELKGKES